MELSVIIVNYNAATYLARCIRSVQRHFVNVEHEICVVDNDSSDGSAQAIGKQFPEVQIIFNKSNLGFAKAINIGLANTSGRNVMWLNPDSEVLDGGIAELLRYMEIESEVGILGPQVVNPDGSIQFSCRAFPSAEAVLFNRFGYLLRRLPRSRRAQNYLQANWDHATTRTVDWVSGACLLHRRALGDEIGGLDEDFFMYGEDIDFCLRATQAGWKIHYHPGLRVLHHIAGSSRQVPFRMIFARHRTTWRYYAKHSRRSLWKDALVGAGNCGLTVLSVLREGLNKATHLRRRQDVSPEREERRATTL